MGDAMGLYLPHVRSLTVRTLKEYDRICITDTSAVGLYSEDAVALVLGTLAKESDFGYFLKQRNRGPARGAGQMERPTFDWLRGKYRLRYPPVSAIEFEMLEWNLRAAIIMARLRYRPVKAALPSRHDIRAMARYWKKNYNTKTGRGTIDEFVDNFRKYVGGA